MKTGSPLFVGFSSLLEDYTGQKLALMYAKSWPQYHRWLNRAPEKIPAVLGRNKLEQYMPEIVLTYDTLCLALGGDEIACSFLSLYNPPIYKAGCSQATKVGNNIELVRNYDYPMALCERTLLHTNWNGTRVIAMTDCLWGVLDGMNEHGLTLSLAYGGRNKYGDGFSITLVLRYILEFCCTIQEALDVLKCVPVHMAYNITLTDRFGAQNTVILCPGEKIQITYLAFATNHQNDAAIENIEAIADSYTRQQYLSTHLADPKQQDNSLVELFLQRPLLRNSTEWSGWGTIYTARYLPLLGKVELHWPNGQKLSQSFDYFVENEITVSSSTFN